MVDKTCPVNAVAKAFEEFFQSIHLIHTDCKRNLLIKQFTLVEVAQQMSISHNVSPQLIARAKAHCLRGTKENAPEKVWPMKGSCPYS